MSLITTLYGAIDESIFEACKKIRLVVLDVDGVLSDGLIYLGNSGEELKAFNTKDGYGIKALVKNGVEVAVITGRHSNIVESRMRSLHVKHIIQGSEDKQTALQQIKDEFGYKQGEIASIGDDMPDLGLYALSNLRVAVSDAHPYVLQQANVVTSLPGGRGAVREFCDLILQSRDALEGVFGTST